jgi:hypothetical protein
MFPTLACGMAGMTCYLEAIGRPDACFGKLVMGRRENGYEF